MAINYADYINRVDKKIRAEERTAGPNNKAGIQKINKWHEGKNKMESIVRQLSQLDRELAGRIADEKELGKDVAAIEKKIIQVTAALKKTKTGCANIKKNATKLESQAKTLAQQKNAAARLKTMKGAWSVGQEEIRHNEKVLANARDKKKVLVSQHAASVRQLNALSNQKQKLINSFKKTWDGLPK